MNYFLVFLYWLLRRGPMTLGILAAAVLGVGFYLQIIDNKQSVEREAAFLAGPPAVVDVTQFDREIHMTDRREVVIRAQPVFELAYRLTYTRNSSEDYAYMVPLIAPDADDETLVHGIALYTSNRFTFDDLTPELLMTDLSGYGDFGPIVDINGRVSSLGKWQDMTDEAFWEQGLTLADDAVIFKPYLEGRAAAFAPTEISVFQIFSYVAGALGLLALVKLVIRNKPDDARGFTPEAPQTSAFVQPTSQPTSDPTPAPVAQASAVPLWKQRAGLVDEADLAMADPARVNMPSVDPSLNPARTPLEHSPLTREVPKITLRKVLIGIVGGLFFLGLGATVFDLISKSSSAPVEAAPTIQETVAEGIADVIVPDADPDRHWTDIDIGPMVEWVVAKGLLAISGDTDAMILCGSMIGALLFLMFMMRYFLVVRFALKPKSHSSFSDLYSR